MPLLICGDVFAISYYNRYCRWDYVLKTFVWMAIGVLLGVFYGTLINESIFRTLMAFIIIGSVGLMFYWDTRKNQSVPTHWSFAGVLGVAAGFTSMVGNLAGPISNIYFLAQKLPKNEFIGTAAWLFFIVNLFKLPFHIWVWETVQIDSLKVSVLLLPFVILGLYLGIKMIAKIKDANYRKLILAFTALGALIILLQ